MEIVINKCFGGFGLSKVAFAWLISNRNWKVTEYYESGHGYKDPTCQLVKATGSCMNDYYLVGDDDSKEIRQNKDIIDCIKELKDQANGSCADLLIVEIPDDVDYEIQEYDGLESIHETHRSW